MLVVSAHWGNMGRYLLFWLWKSSIQFLHPLSGCSIWMHLIPEKNVALLNPFFPLAVHPRVAAWVLITAPHTWLPRQSIQETRWLPKLSISIMYPGYKLAVITNILNVWLSFFIPETWFEVNVTIIENITRNCETDNKITTSRPKPLAGIVCKVILDPVFCNVIIVCGHAQKQ